MSRKFEFRSHNLDLEINGAEFNVDMGKTKEFKKLIGLGDEIASLGKKGDVDDDALNAKFIDAINVVLGENATDKIFRDREINVWDLLDVLNFLLEEVEAYRSTSIAQKYNISLNNSGKSIN